MSLEKMGACPHIAYSLNTTTIESDREEGPLCEKKS